LSIYDEAIQRAGRTLTEGVRRLLEGTTREAAERTHTFRGPSTGDLEARGITRFRFVSDQGGGEGK